MNTPKIIFIENVGFQCQNCGVCCRMQPPDVDEFERKRIEDSGFKDFYETDENGLNWIKRKKDGACMFLTGDNTCQIHSVRPAVCKLEPFTIVDYDYERNTVELALNFPFSSCCAGVEVVKTFPKDEITKATQILIGKIVALTAQDLELPESDKRVLAETRSRLLRRWVEMANLQV
ncbi:MAG: YkgJ family cysteine cluster protein [Candidatus Bathyarchaeota archaeon]|nr:YkgJ family cysteine cluster protein [Candidatus Bathyarchaeota archaeon]